MHVFLDKVNVGLCHAQKLDIHGFVACYHACRAWFSQCFWDVNQCSSQEAIFPVTSGDMFCLSAHNMITANFAVSVGQGIEKLVLNPTAEFVTSNLGSKSISQFSKIGCKT